MAKGCQEGRQTVQVEVREEDDEQSPGRRRWREEPWRKQEPGEDRKDLQVEVPGVTQAAVMRATHGGADGRRSYGGGRADHSRGKTDGKGSRWWWSLRRRRRADEQGRR